eukprot:3129408-Prymnesium_polylepis.1
MAVRALVRTPSLRSFKQSRNQMWAAITQSSNRALVRTPSLRSFKQSRNQMWVAITQSSNRAL